MSTYSSPQLDMCLRIKTIENLAIGLTFAISILTNIDCVSSISIAARTDNLPWLDIKQKDFYFQENALYEFLCVSEHPVEWNYTGVLDSYRIGNLIERKGIRFSNQLAVQLTYKAVGIYTCAEVYEGLHNPLQQISFRLFVNGTTKFLSRGENINLNYLEDKRQNIIPCSLTNPLVSPVLKENTQQNIQASFDPIIGFKLEKNVEPGEVYECCLPTECIQFSISGHPFSVYPEKEKFYPLDNIPVLLKCQGDSSLQLTLNNGDTSKSNISVIRHQFIGGPEMKGIIQIQNTGQKTKVECSDSKNRHVWTILPSKPSRDQGHSSLQFWTHRSSFICNNEDPTLKIRNLFCENKNNCDLKERCFQEDSCADFIKKGSKCDEPACTQLRDPFSTGTIECTTAESLIRWYYFTGLNRQKYLLDEKDIPVRAMVKIEDFQTPYYRGLSKPLIVYCQHVLFTLATGAVIQIEYKNGTVQNLDKKLPKTQQDNEESKKRRLRDVAVVSAKFEPTTDMEKILCNVPKSGSKEFVTDSRDLRSIDAEPPKIWGFEDKMVLYLNEVVSQHVLCNVTGAPLPKTSWMKIQSTPAGRNDESFALVTNSSWLTFHHVNESSAGKYICFASNELGNATKILEISVKPLPDSRINRSIWILVPALIVVIMIIFWLFFVYRRRTMQLNRYLHIISEHEVTEFFHGNAKLLDQFTNETSATDVATLMPYNSLYEVPEDNLRYSVGDVIGKGEYGIVYRGTLNENRTVAIKTIIKSDTKSLFTALLAEIKVMIYIGYHPCVVEFVGAITKNMKQMEAYAIVEYCEQGDLHSYLESIRKNPSEFHELNGRYMNNVSNLLPLMMDWCQQICSGAEHLAKRKIVHGDIAARNILLDNKLRAKIGDFGLSCKVTDYSEYVKKGQTNPLPWRWMALESLQRYKFSFASDVWAVGVTLWEIFSLGDTPYPGMSWNNDFVTQIANGFRLSCPNLCPNNIHEVLLQTWNSNSDDRISIGELKNIFEVLVSEIK